MEPERLNEQDTKEVDREKMQKNDTNQSNEFECQNAEEEEKEGNHNNAAIEPPDKGWAWLIAIGSWMIHLLIPMPVSVFGILYSEVLMKNDVSSTTVGLIFAMQQCIWNISGIFIGPLCSVLGWRKAAFVGSSLCGFGIILSSFATEPWHLFIFFSLFFGIGPGLAIPPCHFIVPYYFKKRRGLVMGLMMTCISSCFFFSPIILTYLRVSYGYKGSIAIIGALMLNGCVAAMVFHPVEWHARHTPMKIKTEIGSNTILKEIPNDEDTLNKNSVENIPESRILLNPDYCSLRDISKENVAEQTSCRKVNMCSNYYDDSHSIHSSEDDGNNCHQTEISSLTERSEISPHHTRDHSRLENIPLIVPEDKNSLELIKVIARKKRALRIMSISECSMHSLNKMNPPYISDSPMEFERKNLISKEVLIIDNDARKRIWTRDHLKQSYVGSLTTIDKLKKNKQLLFTTEGRGEYRDQENKHSEFKKNIISRCRMERRPSSSSVYSINSLHASYIPDNIFELKTSLNDTTSIPPERREKFQASKTKGFLQALRALLKTTMSNFLLIKSYRMQIIALSYATTIAAYMNGLMLIPFILKKQGHGLETASWALSIAGMINTCTRIIVSVSLDHINFSVRYIFMFGAFCQTSSLIGFTMTSDITLLMCFFALFAIGAGCCVVLLFILIIEVMGLELLPKVFCIHSLFIAIGALVTAPLIGAIRDWTGSYDVPLICLSCLALTSFVLHLFMPMAAASDKRRNCAQPTNQTTNNANEKDKI